MAAPVKALFRRREVLLPTLWGWLVILALLAAGAWALARSIGGWLAVTETSARLLDGVPPPIMVEGWLGERELDDAAAYIRSQGYRLVVATGGPIEFASGQTNFAERAAAHLRIRLPGVQVEAAPAPMTRRDRTYVSALFARAWLVGQGWRGSAIDVYTVGAHARRSRWLYRAAFGAGVDVGVVSGNPYGHDVRRWWTTSDGTKLVWTEAFSLAWTWCCFRPQPQSTNTDLVTK